MEDPPVTPTNVKAAGHIQAIDQLSVHRICSGQVVLTLATAVKELLENSIDAGATSVEIKLREYGSESIEVADNGCGVHESNFEGLTLKHHTSKLQDFDDLVNVTSFGFRGEALSSLCALSNMVVTTRHTSASVGTKLEFDLSGRIVSRKSAARQVGTTVHVHNIFHTLPVRQKEFHRNLKKEFARLVHVLNAYCLISTGVRISCSNQVGKGSRSTVVSTSGNQSLVDNIANVFGPKQVQSLVEFTQRQADDDVCSDFGVKPHLKSAVNFRIEGFISKCEHGQGRSSSDRQFIFINRRPCDHAKILKLVNEVYHSYNRHQNPFIALSVAVDKESVDVNVTPDKRQIFLEGENLLLATLKTSLVQLFQSTVSVYKVNNVLPSLSAQSFNSSSSNSLLASSTPGMDHQQQQVSSCPSLARSLSRLKRSFSSAFARTGVSDGPDSLGSDLKSNSPSCVPKSKSSSSPALSEHGSITQFFSRSSPKTSSASAAAAMMRQLVRCSQQAEAAVKDKLDTSDAARVTAQLLTYHEQNDDRLPCDTPLSDNELCPLNLSHDNTDPRMVDISASKLVLTKSSTGQSCQQSRSMETSEQRPLHIESEQNMTRPSGVTIHMGHVSPVFVVHHQLPSSESLHASDVDRESVRHLNQLNGQKEGGSKLDELDGQGCDLSVDELDGQGCDISVDESDGQKECGINVDEHQPFITELDLVHEDTEISCRREQRVPFCLSSLKGKISSQVLHSSTATCGLVRNFRARISPTDNKSAEDELQREISKEMFSKMEVIGQFNLGFIITRLGRDLFIVDQHATDEKYNFEMLQKSTVLQSQKLIVPQSLELTPSNETILVDNLQVFHKNGFDFIIDAQAAPTQRVKLVSAPVSKNWSFGKDDIEELLFMLSDSPNVMCWPSRVRMMFASRACRKSVMIGTALNKYQMRRLVDHMGQIEQPWNCPHGRPTMRHLFNLDMLPS